MKKKFYATVRWCEEDIMYIRPDWSIERCRLALKNIEQDLEDKIVEFGWEMLESLIGD